LFNVSRFVKLGLKGERLKIELIRNGQRLLLNTFRDFKTNIPTSARKTVIKELEPGIWFLNLNILNMKQWDSMLPTLEKAKGIIFDLSIYPKSNDKLLANFIKKPIRSSNWSVPEIIYPDRKNKMEFDTTAFWFILPKKPFLKAKVVYIISNQAQSYAESFLEQVETYKLGTIIGQPTSGINGMINYRYLPGGFYTRITGAKVTKQNGEKLFIKGVTPSILIETDYNSLINGVDKELEKALEIIKEQINDKKP
jgi:C-terminal processing protease CtpA/Prc